MNILFVRLLYWPCWALYQLIRFGIATPLMILAFIGFIGGAISLFLSSWIAKLAYKAFYPHSIKTVQPVVVERM